ncbi:hypothetical protein PG999_006469 [Apiospora kogelbergensis]|uniref:BHLH domain-containing protein n=1 Tax=Apiospora kogelbergensis TaxID=1337665 RepID=A0AAW0QQV1_9PEZI
MGDRSQKQPKHDASSNGEEQIEGFQGSSSNGYEELARKTQDLISRRDDLEDTLRLNSKARKQQKRWEKECRKHLKLLDKHLARTDAGHHTIPSKAVRVDAKSLQALLSVAQTYLRDLQRIQESLAAEHGLGSVSGPASAAAPRFDSDKGRGSSQPSLSAGETVQGKWRSLSRRSSARAPGTSTAVRIPVPAPRTPDSGLDRRHTYIAPGPATPQFFTSYAPCLSTPDNKEFEGVKDNDTRPTSPGKKRRKRSYAEWLGKSTTPIPPPTLPTSRAQKMISTTPIPPPILPSLAPKRSRRDPGTPTHDP